MKIGHNSGGWPLISFERDLDGWHLDINEGGRGLIFSLHHTYRNWGFVYAAFWFTPRIRGRFSKMWSQ